MMQFHGAARERGRQHGEALRQAIATRVATAIPESFASDAPHMQQVVAPWRWSIAQLCPWVLAELGGIADGACRSLDEIVLLNAFEAFDLADQVELGGCTAVGVVGQRGAVVGQNWDANASLAASIDIHVHSGPDTPTTVLVASPGGLGWIGMNEHGVALVNNDLLTTRTRQGLGSQPARRRALRARTVGEATASLIGTPAVGGRAYMVGDAWRGLATIEVAAHAQPWVVHHARHAVHTNHCQAASIRDDEDRGLLAATYPSSSSRQQRAEQLIERSDQPPTELVAAVLGDHVGRPLSICRHQSPDELTVTAASVVFDCGERIARIALGNPCTARVTTIQL